MSYFPVYSQTIAALILAFLYHHSLSCALGEGGATPYFSMRARKKKAAGRRAGMRMRVPWRVRSLILLPWFAFLLALSRRRTGGHIRAVSFSHWRYTRHLAFPRRDIACLLAEIRLPFSIPPPGASTNYMY